MSRQAVRRGMLAIAAASVLLLGACTPAPAPRPSGSPLQVVAAEDVWGQLAGELGGGRVTVKSLVANPNADPHEYEPTVADARAVADSDVTIANGGGYDAWFAGLLAADPSGSRIELAAIPTTASPTGNPHVWYDPATVNRMARAISHAFAEADPEAATKYSERLGLVESDRLGPYNALVAQLRSRYAGVPIGSTESIFVPMADALGLRVLTPASFMASVSEGTDPGAAAKSEADAQVRSGAITVLVYNAQNATPDVAALVQTARSKGIPVVVVTETIPRGETFLSWQMAQLQELQAALKEATGR